MHYTLPLILDCYVALPIPQPLRMQLANLSALLILGTLLLFPWFLQQTSHSLDSLILFPSEFTRQIPNRCQIISLYIRYPGCQTECPQALTRLARAHDERMHEELCILFLSLFADQAQATTHYALHFHPQIKGISLSGEGLKSVLSDFGIEQPPSQRHKDLIYTLKKQKNDWILQKTTPATQWSLELKGVQILK